MTMNTSLEQKAVDGADAIQQLIKERNDARANASAWAKEAQLNRAKIEMLERHNSQLDAKLSYYHAAYVRLLQILSTFKMSVVDAEQEARRHAHDEAPVRPLTPDQNLQIEKIAQNFAPLAEPPNAKP